MNLAEKLKHLREVEGELRNLSRPMTQVEVVKAMQEELHETLSQAYLSQIESGKRVHLTQASRELLANFFKVHPGYLVNDPPDYSTDLLTDMENHSNRFETWLLASAAEWITEPIISHFFEQLASVEEPQQYLAVFQQLLHLPLEELEKCISIVDSQDIHSTS